MQKTQWWRVVQSVMASMIGVQSDKNREHDFTTDNPLPYIVVGLVAVFLFVVLLVSVVALIV